MRLAAAMTLSSGFTTERKKNPILLWGSLGSFRGYSFIATNDFAQQSIVKYPLKCLGLSEERAAVRLKANCNIWSSESIGFALVWV